MTRAELAQKLRENRSVIDYVNPSDKHFWNHTYLVYLDTGCYVGAVFLVHANCEQDAVDEVADYAKKKGCAGYFADDETVEELRRDAVQDGHDEDAYLDERYISAGNEGDYMCIPGVIYQLYGVGHRLPPP